jgi:hypothetical protein
MISNGLDDVFRQKAELFGDSDSLATWVTQSPLSNCEGSIGGRDGGHLPGKWRFFNPGRATWL